MRRDLLLIALTAVGVYLIWRSLPSPADLLAMATKPLTDAAGAAWDYVEPGVVEAATGFPSSSETLSDAYDFNNENGFPSVWMSGF